MIPFKEYFKVLLYGNPDKFIDEYFNDNDTPYPERFDEFEEHLRALYESDTEITEEMQDAIEEIEDVEGGYYGIDD